MINFLEETLEMLKKHGKSPKDVKWVGSENFGWFTWEEFEKIANFEYDNDYGAQEIAYDLVIVGKDWWLERGEYDGSEWWEFKQLPEKPKNHKVPTKLCCSQTKDLNGWESLKTINKEGSYE